MLGHSPVEAAISLIARYNDSSQDPGYQPTIPCQSRQRPGTEFHDCGPGSVKLSCEQRLGTGNYFGPGQPSGPFLPYSKPSEKHSGMMTFCPFKIGALEFPPSWRTLRACVSRVRRSGPAIVFCAVASSSFAQNQVSEYDVKAAYLFNFGKFVRYAPSEAVIKRQSFDLCIIGENPLANTLDELAANEHLDGKPARVLRFKTVSEARECAIAYISGSEGARIGADLDALRGQAVLTVSDAGSFLQHGGMVQFITVGNHVRFAVNLDAVRKAQLSLSSELLKVAISVNGEPPKGVAP